MKKFNPIMKSIVGAIALTSSLAWAGGPDGHYVPGAEGVAAASAPPPGLYYLGYLVNYDADSFKTASSKNTVKVTALANRVAWISNTKILGADYGAEIIVPVLQAKTNLAIAHGTAQTDSGVGDIYAGPLILSWHGANWDAVAAAGYWLNTGHFDAGNDASVGKGYKGTMYTAGGVYHLDDKKSWSISLLNRYEVNGRRSDGYKPGDVYTSEWGVGKNLGEYTLGVVGYRQSQVSDDQNHPSGVNTNFRSRNGIGMEVSTPLKSLGVMMKAAYYTETSTNDMQGNTLRFTFIKPL